MDRARDRPIDRVKYERTAGAFHGVSRRTEVKPRVYPSVRRRTIAYENALPTTEATPHRHGYKLERILSARAGEHCGGWMSDRARGGGV